MRKLFIINIIILQCFLANAQPFAISFNNHKKPVEVVSKKPESQRLRFNYPGIHIVEVSTKEGIFNQMAVPGTYRSGKVGEPQMVSSQKLIAVPIGADVTVNVNSYQKEEYKVANFASNKPIIPYQPSVSKSNDTSANKLVISKSAYQKNRYPKQSLASVEVLGTMHGIKIAKITINPVRYNPTANSLVFYNNIEVEVSYKNADFAATTKQSSTAYSPYFNSQLKSVLSSTFYPDNPDLVKQPVRYLLVTPNNYLNSLHNFIEWKTQKGFEVVVGNTAQIGSTAAQIKTWIKTQYNDTAGGNPAPSFLLLVGDVGQIPFSQIGTSTTKPTDLYYASVDGDMFPDLYYGRLPANDTIQLLGMLNKILLYEQYQFPNDAFLNDVTLIAGADGTYNPLVAQPTIKYGTEYYFNATQGFSSVNAYLASYAGCYSIDKMGVSFINYTAHGSQTSWVSPVLSATSVSGFNNFGKYPLVVANCCQSGDFSFGGTSIGEAWIRNPNGGAIAYIGSLPDTYWYEDFYWAVGAHAPVDGDYPTVAGSSIGMYDAPFISDYQTADALLFAGNLAVTEAHNQAYTGEVDSKYYWEAYHCLGDPSVIPYFKSGLVQTVGHLPKLESGIGEFMVEALPGSQVTLSTHAAMLATETVSATGIVTLVFDPNFGSDSVKLVVTRPKYKPYITDIPVTVSQSSYLALKSVTVSHINGAQDGMLDYNEKAALNIEIENIGDTIGENVLVNVSCTDANIRSITHTVYDNLELIPTGGIVFIDGFFEIQAEDSVPDQHIVWVSVQLSDSSPGKVRKYYNYQRPLILNAPNLQVLSSLIVDDFGGNGNNWAEIGEPLTLTVGFVNTGHAQVSATAIFQSEVANPIIQVSDSSIYYGNINPGDTVFQNFPAQVIENPLTIADTLSFSLTGTKYQKTRSFVVPVGLSSHKNFGSQEVELIDYPFNNWYKNNRTQLLFTNEEIGQGICQITALGFDFSTITANVAYHDLWNFTIRVLPTNVNALSGFVDMSNSQLVYSQPLYYLPNLVGWQTIHLHQPILQTTASNLVIEIAWGTNDNFPLESERTKVYGSNTLFNSVAYGFDDNTNPPDLSGISKLRPDMEFIYDTLSILTVDVYGNLPLSSSLEVSGCNLSIGGKTYVTDELGRAKHITNQANELLQIGANAYGYRDTSFTYLKNELYSHLSLPLERNPKMVVEVSNHQGMPISGAQFTINGYSFVTNQQGKLDCFAAEKEVFSSYIVSKPGYHSIADSLNPSLLSDTLKIVLEYDLIDATFIITNTQLNPIFGTMVSVDGESFYTDVAGKATFNNLANGNHTYRINAAGFKEKTGEFLMLDSDTLFSIELLTMGLVQCNITAGFLPLDEAELELDGIIHFTDVFGNTQFELIVEGSHSWKAFKQGYYESTGTISTYGSSTQLDIILTPIPDLTFYVNNGLIALNEASITFNNSSYLSNANGLLELKDVEPGFYQYSVEKTGFETISGTFNLEVSDTILNIKMQSIPDIKISVLDANGPVEGAIVKINSDSLVTNSLGEAVFADLSAGNYSVMVGCVGYRTKISEIELLGTDTSFVVVLSKNPEITWQITSGSSPVDSATIQFNGKEYLTSVFGNLVVNDMEDGSYNYSISKPGYVAIDSTVQVNGTSVVLKHSLEKLSDFELIVVDTSNNPISNVTVSLEVGEFITDLNGKSIINGIREGWHRYTLSKVGYVTVSDSVLIDTDMVTKVALMLLEQRTYDVIFKITDNAGDVALASISFDNKVKTTNSTGEGVFYDVIPTDSMGYLVRKTGTHINDTGFVSLKSDTIIHVNLLAISVNSQLTGELSVFPNPAKEKILVTGNQLLKGLTYQIYNTLGKIVLEGAFETNSNTVDLSNQKPGIYYLFVRFADGNRAIKIVKE